MLKLSFPISSRYYRWWKKNIYDDGNNNVVNVIGVKFTDLTDEQQSIIEKYGIEVVLPSDDVKKDIKSATIDTSF